VRPFQLIESVVSAHDGSPTTFPAGAGRFGLVDWVCSDRAAAAAFAGVAEGAVGSAGGAQGRQSYSYLDDSAADYGPAKGAVFRKDEGLPGC
jgi:hypothetical protein